MEKLKNKGFTMDKEYPDDDIDNLDFDIRELVVDKPAEQVDFARAAQSVVKDIDRLLS